MIRKTGDQGHHRGIGDLEVPQSGLFLLTWLIDDPSVFGSKKDALWNERSPWEYSASFSLFQGRPVGGSGGSAEPPVLGWVPSRTGWVGEGWKEKKEEGKKKRKRRNRKRRKERRGKERDKGNKRRQYKTCTYRYRVQSSFSGKPSHMYVVRNPVLMAHIE